MQYSDFLETIIERGVSAARRDYVRIKTNGKVIIDEYKLEGAVAGFEACKNKLPQELIPVWINATEKMNAIAKNPARDARTYWFNRCYQAEIEWILDVVSAMLVNNGKTQLLKHLPTKNGMLMAKKILLTERN